MVIFNTAHPCGRELRTNEPDGHFSFNEKGQEEEMKDEEEEKDDEKEKNEEEEEEADAQEEENLDAKVASMSCPRIWIKVRAEEGQVEISVAQNDSVHGSISSALGSGACSPARASSCHSAHACC